MMHYRHSIFGLFLLFILLSSASASESPQVTGYNRDTVTVDKTFSYRTSLLDENLNPASSPGSKVLKFSYSVDLEYIFKWKLSILMGEPVVIGWVAYKPTHIKTWTPELQLGLNNTGRLSKVRMTEFKMKVRMYLHPPGERALDRGATVQIDAGSPGKSYMGHPTKELLKARELFSKFASFNSPGSPDWDKLFTNISDKQQARKYFLDLDAAAKQRDRYYAAYYDHDVVKVNIDTSIIDNYIRDYLKELEEKVRKQQKQKETKDQQQADELDAALAETEFGASGTDDLFSDEISTGEKSFEDLLEDTEEITLIIDEVPRTTSSNVISISGRVENVSSIDSSEIVFNVNGLEQPVYLANDGSFRNKVVLFNGENQIDINYTSAAKNEKKTIHVTSSTPPVKARFTLTWDSGNSDMDLHAYGPNGDHCSFGSKSTKNMQLDVDNTSGYGPENISVKLNQHPGTYKVYINHYGGHSGNVTLYIYLDNRLIATEKRNLSGRRKWHAYTLEIE